MIKLMLVDDEVGFATALKERLELRGYDVCLALNGKDSIDMMHEECPEVVLLDLSLPDMDGFIVMQKIKDIDKSVGIIILSGHGLEHRASALEKGAFSYIMKPFKLPDLIEIISGAVQNKTADKGD